MSDIAQIAGIGPATPAVEVDEKGTNALSTAGGDHILDRKHAEVAA